MLAVRRLGWRRRSVSPLGLEPRTNSLKGYCSTIELWTLEPHLPSHKIRSIILYSTAFTFQLRCGPSDQRIIHEKLFHIVATVEGQIKQYIFMGLSYREISDIMNL